MNLKSPRKVSLKDKDEPKSPRKVSLKDKDELKSKKSKSER